MKKGMLKEAGKRLRELIGREVRWAWKGRFTVSQFDGEDSFISPVLSKHLQSLNSN